MDDSQSIEETQMDDDDEGVRILSSVDVTFRILFWYPESTNASLEGFAEKEIQFGTHSRCVFCLFSTLPCLFVFSRTQLPFLQKLSEIMWNFVLGKHDQVAGQDCLPTAISPARSGVQRFPICTFASVMQYFSRNLTAKFSPPYQASFLRWLVAPTILHSVPIGGVSTD